MCKIYVQKITNVRNRMAAEFALRTLKPKTLTLSWCATFFCFLCFFRHVKLFKSFPSHTHSFLSYSVLYLTFDIKTIALRKETHKWGEKDSQNSLNSLDLLANG